MVDLRWILETLPIGIWVARVPTGEVTYSNSEFEKILGIGAVAESRIQDAPTTYGIFDREGRPYPVDRLPFSRVASAGRPVTVDDIVIHRPDGRKVDVRAYAYPAFDDEGTLSHVVVAFIDITAEVKAKAEGEKTQSHLAFAVDHAPIVIWTIDVHGIVTMSEGAGLKSMGVRSGQLVGQNLFDLYRDHPTIPGYLRRGLSGESVWYTVTVGEATYDTWLLPLRDARRTITGAAGLSNDVSELRKLQAAAIQNDRAVALGTLAASVAHEINNPLTYMLGHLASLQGTLDRMDRILPSLPEAERAEVLALTGQMRKALEPVRAGTERIADITRDLRSFTRPASEETGSVDVRAVVDSVLKLVKKEMEARARLEVTLGATVPVEGNSARLAQVVLNLLVNAMQAVTGDRPDEDDLWIRTGTEGDTVFIEVADSGPGVPREDRERIFEPFVTTKEVGQGTGLGLFVCRNIVRDFSGKVTVGDRPGGGALFRVELPALPAADGSRGKASPEAPAGGKVASALILIVDDEPQVADMLAHQLVSAGYRARVESDAGRVLEMLTGEPESVDLVFCDLIMKKMSGMDFADALSVRAPAQLSKVVFMTGGAFTPRSRAFREGHASQCVDKPFDVLLEAGRRLSKGGA